MKYLLPLLLVLLVASGCAPPTGQIERAIERELPTAIGPADRYQVTITGLSGTANRAERVEILGERVRLPDAPELDRLAIRLDGVRLDSRRESIERADSTRASVRMTASALESYLRDHPNLRDATVSLRAPDRATLRVRPTLGGLSAGAVDIEGRLAPDAGGVGFAIGSVRAGEFGLSEAVTRRLSDMLNPLVDLAGTPGDLRVTGVRVEDGVLHLDATGDATGLRFR